MIFALDDLTTPLTRQQVQQSIYGVLGTVGVNTTSWKPGAVVRTMIVAVSVVLSSLTQLTAKIARSGFLELAEGVWLTLVAHYVYNVDRFAATFAPGFITLTNAGGGVYSPNADDLVFSNPSTGKTYRNTTTFTLGAMATITVPILAVEAGSSSTSAPGAISVLETTLLGVTCSNGLALVGRDEESDPALRTRCSEKLGALSPFGPWDAYANAVRNTTRADGSSTAVTRVRTVKNGYGDVTTYVATPSGAVAGTVGDLTTDLGLVDEQIQQFAAPLAVTADTQSATPLSISVAYEVWCYNTTGLTQAGLLAAIATRLATFMSTQPIGGNIAPPSVSGQVFVDAIRTVIGASLPQIFHVLVTTPSADVAIASSEVPVLGTVSCTAVHFQAPPEGLFS
jgi:phage-related baseplate assembly protein